MNNYSIFKTCLTGRQVSTVLLFFSIQIATAQSNFDLLELKLNTQTLNDVIGIERTVDQRLDTQTYKMSKSPRLIAIDGITIQNQEVDDTRVNQIWFEYEAKDNLIKGYQLVYYTLPVNPKIVYHKMVEKFGEPDYRYYGEMIGLYDDEDLLDFEAVIWEDRENGVFYTLRYTDWDNTIRELRMNAMVNTLSELDKDPSYAVRPYMFWKDYIIARENSPIYFSYQSFIKRKGGEYIMYTK